MTKRIFRSICLATMGVFIACVILFLGVLYQYMEGVEQDQLRVQTELAASGVSHEGRAYLDSLEGKDYRITWIGRDGEVLFDNRSDSQEMENHLRREEIQEAIKTGEGESSRYSSTLMEKAFYCARRLDDGSLLRLSVSRDALLALVLGMLQPICIILVVAVLLSFILAHRLSKRIVRPLNELDLEKPLANEGYEELTPLLRRIDSQQKQIEIQQEELARKQQEFEAVTENMREGIILINTNGIVIGINNAARELLETDAACIGSPLLSVNGSGVFSELLKDAEKGGHRERSADLRGGRYQLLLNPVKTGGELSGYVLLAIDVTEKETAEQMRREFTANVSHELKTPLHTIAGSAELLAGGNVKKEDEQYFYARIEKESQRMIRLVDDIIRLSHLDEGADDMKREKVDLFSVAGETVRALQAEADRAHVSIALEGGPATVYGIPQLLQSIVFNLCDNAVKYNRENGSVSVSVRKEEDGVRLRVADTGIGIPAEHQQRIFERFYRVDKSRSRELGGTGLGLSIVKHAAALHKARIDLQSGENTGTTVTVVFPDSTE